MNCNENVIMANSGFTPAQISTTTIIGSLGTSVNILDVAKYLELDRWVVGVKLVYARGASTIIRGVAKLPKMKKKRDQEGFYKDFYNQVTCTVRLPDADVDVDIEQGVVPGQRARIALVSCKVFHNGTLHVTGGHSRAEAMEVCNLLLDRLNTLSGCKLIRLIPDLPYLCSYDNLLYASNGNVIGWSYKDVIHVGNEYVALRKLDELGTVGSGSGSGYVFVSDKWNVHTKRVYSLNGQQIGRLKLVFDHDVYKRHYDVKFGCIYNGHRIIGKEVFLPKGDDDISNLIRDTQRQMDYLRAMAVVPHIFTAFPSITDATAVTPLSENSFKVHMINMFCQAPFRINRSKLHLCFQANEYYSRLEPCDNAAVNLRFHYNPAGDSEVGKCRVSNKQTCGCKDISVSCFNSGKLNIAGLATVEQGAVVYAFLVEFFMSNRSSFEAKLVAQ